MDENYVSDAKQSASIGLRSFLTEIIAVGVMASAVSVTWSLIEIRGVIARSRAVENQIVTIASATTALADRATTRLEEFEQLRSESIPDLGFRAEPVDSTQPADADSHSHRQLPTQQQPLFPLPE